MAGEGAEWLLKIEAELSGAKAAEKELGKVEEAAGGADRMLLKLEGDIKGIGPASGKAGSGIKAFATGALSHLAALATFEGLKALGSQLLNFAEDALHAAGEAERMRKSFENSLGVAPAEELLGWMDRLAKHTEFTGGALKGFAGALARAGFEGEGLERAMGATLDLAAQADDKMAGAAEAVALLRKVNLKGSIGEKDLIGAGLAPEKFFKRLAGELGVGLKEVEKQLAEGKVKAETIVENLYSSIVEKTNKPLGGAGVEMSDGFISRLEKAQDIIPNLFEGLDKSGGLANTSEALAKLTAALDPSAPAGKKIIDGLTLMLDKFGKLVNEVDFDHVANQTVRALDVIAAAAKATAGAIDLLITSLDGLHTGWKLLNGDTSGVEKGSVLGDIMDTAKAGGTGNDVVDATVGTGITGWAGRFGKGIGDKIARGLGLGMDDGKKDVAASADALGGAATDAMMSTLEIQSPSRVFKEMGALSSKGYALGIEAGMPEVDGTIEHAFSAGASLAAPDTSAGAAAGGGWSISMPITVNLPGGMGGETSPRETGQAIAEVIEEHMLRVFERLQMQGGGA